jgi:hypothetical protein
MEEGGEVVPSADAASSQPKPPAKKVAKPKPKTATKTATKPKPKTATKTATKPKPKTATKKVAKPKPKTATKRVTKPKTKPKSDETAKKVGETTENRSASEIEVSTKANTRSRPKVRLAHELSSDRRKVIKKALASHKSEHRDEWDRTAGVKSHIILRKRIKPGTMRSFEVPLLDIELGDSWPIPVTVIHGSRPGPVVTISAGIHGDELTGPSACTHLLSSAMTDPGKPLDPKHIAGTIRILPILNIPGYRAKNRRFPDGRDLNRAFPGKSKGNTTSRVAFKIWNKLIVGSDYVVDLHSAAKGRSNMPQIRGDLADPHSNIIAKAFGIEMILDAKAPKGSIRRVAMNNDIGAITYEGGGADFLDHEAVQVAVTGVLNVLKTLHVIPGNPTRPKFRLLASGSLWLRASEGGLLDMFVGPSSIVERGDVVARISDPGTPGLAVDIVAPSDGLMICTATNPFVTAGTPVGHFLPIDKHLGLIMSQCDENNRFVVAGSEAEPVWREETEIDEISVSGEWSGGSVDAEWQSGWTEAAESDDNSESAK